MTTISQAPYGPAAVEREPSDSPMLAPAHKGYPDAKPALVGIKAGRIKHLADKMAFHYAARDIPIVEPYRSIAEQGYHAAREALFDAIDAAMKEHP